MNHPCSRGTPPHGPCSTILLRPLNAVSHSCTSALSVPASFLGESLAGIPSFRYQLALSYGPPEQRLSCLTSLGYDCTADHQLLLQPRDYCVCRYLSRSIFEPIGIHRGSTQRIVSEIPVSWRFNLEKFPFVTVFSRSIDFLLSMSIISSRNLAFFIMSVSWVPSQIFALPTIGHHRVGCLIFICTSCRLSDSILELIVSLQII